MPHLRLIGPKQRYTWGPIQEIARPLQSEMSNEALKLQLDSLRLEKQALAAENARLWDGQRDGAALIDWEVQREHY